MDSNFEKVATFHSHYGAMVFKKKLASECTLAPVPRSLSSSCGTAAFFSCDIPKELYDENLEAVYIAENGNYRRIYGQE